MKGADVLSDETVSIKRVIGGCGYEANRITVTLREQGTIPVLPGRRNHRHLSQHDEFRQKDRWLVEAMFCRLKDFCRIVTCRDKLARSFSSGVIAAEAGTSWL